MMGTDTNPVLRVLVCFSAVAILLALGSYTSTWVGDTRYWHSQDDHMITMRVATNTWDYGRPYFNPTEAVAASTSLFWPIILSPLYAIFDRQMAVVALVVISCLLTALALVRASTLVASPLLRYAVLLLLCLSPPMLAYGATGWEQIPQMLFMTLGLMQIADASLRSDRLSIPFSAVIFVSMTFLFRPDSAPIIAVVVALWCFTERRFLALKTYAMAGALLIIPAAYLTGMQLFYADFVPNTAYLKVASFSQNMVSGTAYLTSVQYAWLAPALLVVAALLPKKHPFDWMIIGLAATQIVYSVSVGGDVFPHGRFFMALVPVLFFRTFQRVASLELNRPTLRPLPIVAGLVILAASSGIATMKAATRFIQTDDHTLSVDELRMAAFIACAVPPQSGSVGMHFLGFAYHLPDHHVVDFLGKSEPHIARSAVKFGPIGHNKWDYDYAFATYDIAAVPYPKQSLDAVQRPGFTLRERDFMYYDVAAQFLLARDDLVYFEPDLFGNRDTGVFLRSDLAALQAVQPCMAKLRES